MVVLLIVLNIILISLFVVLSIYFFRSKKDENKIVCNNIDIDNKDIKIESNKKIKKERVFEGRFVTDEEYQQMMKNRRSDISVLLEELDNEYEHLKELNK
jgi:hypothetical protein